MLLLGHVFKVK